jgi:carbon-monoxide dehydrogenase large subunit
MPTVGRAAEAVYVVERLVDAAADVLSLDPLEIRRRNVIQPDQMPYRTLTGTVFGRGDFPGLLARSKRPRVVNFGRRRKRRLDGARCGIGAPSSGALWWRFGP